MTNTPLVVLHICMGSIALLSGTAALSFRKGERLHRGFGNVFFASMLGMSASGAFLAFIKYERINMVVGALTFYLVSTAWLTVKRKEGETGRFEIIACIAALATGIYGMTVGVEALNSKTGYLDGEPIPAGVYFFFSSVALLAGFLDIKVLIQNGISGKQRIARHLWRMCFAMLIAAASFFLGQEQVFPESLQGSIALGAPVILVLVLLIFWLIRVRFTGWWKEA